MVPLIRQPRATEVEFTLPTTDFQFPERTDQAAVYLGVGTGFRHWDDGDTALRFLADFNGSCSRHRLFAAFGTVIEAPPKEKLFFDPRVRVGRVFHPRFTLGLEGEHLERPFGGGGNIKHRSALGLALSMKM